MLEEDEARMKEEMRVRWGNSTNDEKAKRTFVRPTGDDPNCMP